MDFGFSEEQELLRESCRQLLEQEMPLARVREIAASTEGFDRHLWRRTAELGWTGLAVPEAWGGSGLTLVDLLVLAEEHGRLVQPGPLLSTSLVALALGELGSDAQRGDWLPRIARGECTATWAHYEDGEWDAAGVGLSAERHGGSIRLNGVKRLVADAAQADLLLVSARLPEGTTLLLVPREAPGVTVREHRALDLARRLGEVRFDGTAVPAAGIVCEPDANEPIWRVLAQASVLQGGESLGVAERLLEMTVEYAKTRVQFDRPIGSFQAIRHRCADMRIQLEGMRAAARYAALALQEGFDDARAAVHVAAAYGGDAAAAISGEALQLHGGIAFTWEHDLHYYLRRAKSNQVLFGDPAWHREKVTRLRIVAADGAEDGDG